MVVDLKPVFQRNPNLKEILRSYKDAEKALASGNYHAALLKAQESRDQITEGNALIMCGSIERGLHKLQGAESIYKIYGEWCLNGKESIISSLKNYQSLKTLDNLFNKQKINLLLLCGPHTKNLNFCSQLEEFNLHISTIGRDSVTSTLANLMPGDFSPDAIILLDVYGHRIPNDLYEINIPKVFLTYDFDLQLPNQYQDLQRANLIIANSAYEHYFLDRIYQCPVTSGFNWYLIHTVFADNQSHGKLKKKPPNFENKTIDYMHSGLSFTPTMRDKSQFLFRLATADIPDLNIQIHHGFAERKIYLNNISKTKFMPIFNSRMSGSFQTRTIDALCNGAFVTHGGGDTTMDVIGEFHDLVNSCSQNEIETLLLEQRQYYDCQISQYEHHDKSLSKELGRLFVTPEERTKRFLKFCLFEAARTHYHSRNINSTRTTSIMGINNFLSLARKRNKDAQKLYSAALYRSIEAFLHNPSDKKLHDNINSIFFEAISIFPDSLPLQFNYGRFKWMIGEKSDAYRLLKTMLKNFQRLEFRSEFDMIWLNLFKNSSEMMPHQDYFVAVAKDLAGISVTKHLAKRIIGATAYTYIGLFFLQEKKLDNGIQNLKIALELHPEHFPAARILFKALYAKGNVWKETSKAFSLAVRLYPPYLTELMSFGVFSELHQNKKESAILIVKTWAYFITRCSWEIATEHQIPTENWKYVKLFFSNLPTHLQSNLKEKFPQEIY